MNNQWRFTCKCGEELEADTWYELTEKIDLHERESHGASHQEHEPSPQKVTVEGLIEDGLL